MMVRLGFAVAAHLDPEILVVDEVLAVGDAEFQKKALGKMQDVSRGEGRTVLFVSHNMASIQQLCKTGILLDKGTTVYSGTAADTVTLYTKMSKPDVTRTIYTDTPNKEKLQLLEASIQSSDGTAIYPTSELVIRMVVAVRENITNIVIGFNILNPLEVPIARCDYNDIDHVRSLPVGDYEVLFRIPPYTLTKGEYTMTFDVAEHNVRNYAPEESSLALNIVPDKDRFGNIHDETSVAKCSVVHSKWALGYRKL